MRHPSILALLLLLGCSRAEPAPCPVTTSSGGEVDAASVRVASDSQQPFEADVKELLKISNAVGTAQQAMLPVIGALAQAYPAVPQSVWRELMAAIGADDFTNIMVSVYTRHYSREEVGAMLRFYRSEEGRSIVQKMPAVVADSQRAGAVWGEQLTQKLVQGARSRGYEL